MDAYRLILEERACFAGVIAQRSPTPENMAAYGRAIMNGWDAKLLVAPSIIRTDVVGVRG